MVVSYEIVLTIINLTNDKTKTFTKNFNDTLRNISDEKLYNNHHLLKEKANMFALFKTEINHYCKQYGITMNNIDIDEFDITSNTDRVDVYFEPGDGDDPNQISLEPDIKCYIYPQFESLEKPVLTGRAYDDTTIIWTWEDDGLSHYIVTESIDITNEDDKDKIIAQLPIGTNVFTETLLTPNTSYTRRLISYDANRTSIPSAPVTIQTETAPIDKSLEDYRVNKNYDYTSDDNDRFIIDDNLEAFHSGVGDYNDLKVYKQMDVAFYQKFKAYIKLHGVRIAREQCYDSVGFHYKVCLEADKEVEERKGEVTFDINLYPKETVAVKDYMFATQPVTVCARLQCDVLAKKVNKTEELKECPIMVPVWERNQEPNDPNPDTEEPKYLPLHLILCLDVTNSLDEMLGIKKKRDKNGNVVKKNGVIQYTKKKNYGLDDALVDLSDSVYVCLHKLYKKYKRFGGKKLLVSLIIFRGKASRLCHKVNLMSLDPDEADYEEEERISKILKLVIQGKRSDFRKKLGKELLSLAPKQGTYTNWGAGLSKVEETVKKSKDLNTALIFFSDGGCNTNKEYNGNSGSDRPPTNVIPRQNNRVDKITDDNTIGKFFLKDIKENAKWLRETDHVKSVLCLGPGKYKLDDKEHKYLADEWSGNHNLWFYKSFMDAANDEVRKIGTDDNLYISWTDKEDIEEAMGEWIGTCLIVKHEAEYPFIDPNGNPTNEEYHLEGWSFVGWEESDETIQMDNNWEVDETKWVKVTVPPLSEDPWMITINETNTPVIYARNEQRAIIPPNSIMTDHNDQTGSQEPIQVDERSIQQMILDSFQETDEYRQGYTDIVRAYGNETEQGEYVIRNIAILDTYKYSDDEEVPTVDPDIDFRDLEDGYNGSLNVYAEITRIGDGRSIYFAGDDKYVWVSGYTDAIIYDGERIATAEINAYDRPSAPLYEVNEDYRNLISNCQNRNIIYQGQKEKIFNVMDLIIKDDDVYITNSNGESELVNVGDWTLFVPSGTDTSNINTLIRGTLFPVVKTLTGDITANIDAHFMSPILNYRFNKTDYEAYTNYYEILPGTNPDSPYKNIVTLRIYYARNIATKSKWYPSGNEYIASFGESNIVNTSSPYYISPNGTPDANKFVEGVTIFKEDYIDEYLWFEALTNLETIHIYMEQPNEGASPLYGSVNGRYGNTNKNGRKDLRQVTPKFGLDMKNVSNLGIYIMMKEYYPENALVSYQWEHPMEGKDSITQVDGDVVTFRSDSLTFKDVEYKDLIETITSPSMDLYDHKTTTHEFEITKPETRFEYNKYYIDLFSNNSDVLALNYPKEVFFDPETDKAQFSASFKGVVNATTKWSPRIHNGYYYLNQHEYYAYSDFDVDADFVIDNSDNYDTVAGVFTVNVELTKLAGPEESYTIIKNNRSELIQNEKDFVWVNGKGLTLRPTINGEYFKEYEAKTYYSPVIMFPKILTSADRLKVSYYSEDTPAVVPPELELDLKVRSYDLEEGQWGPWKDFINNSVPDCKLSCGYQVSFDMTASKTDHDKSVEDYLCCYLDWCDDEDRPYCINVVTITDHLQAGEYHRDGVFVSRILDYGTLSDINLSLFASNIEKKCTLYISVANDINDISIENCKWTLASDEVTFKARFIRYKIVIPEGEKVYWLHKKIVTKESEVILPYLMEIRMSGKHKPSDVKDTFQEIQSFEITTDGLEHKVFPSIYDIISSDVIKKGFTAAEISSVRINSTNSNIHLRYNPGVDASNPSVESLRTPIYATADYRTKVDPMTTPYIYAGRSFEKDLDVISITRGTPQQYSPITVEDADGIPYKQVYDIDPDTFYKKEIFEIQTEDDQHFIKLDRNDFDIKTLSFMKNAEPFTNYELRNNLVIFNDLLEIGDIIEVNYRILHSFYAIIDRKEDTTDIVVYSDYDTEEAKKNDLENVKPITGTKIYNECHIDQIYLYSNKFGFNGSEISEINAWRYDASMPAIISTNNSSTYFNTIIDTMILTPQYEFKFNVSSEARDNDIVGFIIGCVKDTNKNLHTLSYLVALPNNDECYFDGDGGNRCNTAIVYDYGMTSQRILVVKNIPCNYTYWNEMFNGIRVTVKKNDEKVQCKISYWNEPDRDNNLSLIEYVFDNNNITRLFAGNVNYGFCTKSQDHTIFENCSFTGLVDKSVSVKEQLLKLKRKYKVYFETSKTNNKFIADHLSLNPIYRTDYKGFIYLTDEHNEPYYLRIHCNPKYIKAGGYDKIDVSVECLDRDENPVVSKEIYIDCEYGILIFDNDLAYQKTDINGVVHFIYESGLVECTDHIRVRTLTSDNKVIESSEEIISE